MLSIEIMEKRLNDSKEFAEVVLDLEKLKENNDLQEKDVEIFNRNVDNLRNVVRRRLKEINEFIDIQNYAIFNLNTEVLSFENKFLLLANDVNHLHEHLAFYQTMLKELNDMYFEELV